MNAATFATQLRVVAEAEDDVGVARVRFFVDGHPAGGAIAAPFAIDLDPKTIAIGAHTLTAQAYEAAGNRGDAPPVAFERIRPSDVAGKSCGCGSTNLGPWLLAGLAAVLRARRRLTGTHR